MAEPGDGEGPRRSKRAESAWKYAHLGLQLGFTFLLFFALGHAADRYLETMPWLTITGTFVGFAVGMYHLFRTFL